MYQKGSQREEEHSCIPDISVVFSWVDTRLSTESLPFLLSLLSPDLFLSSCPSQAELAQKRNVCGLFCQLKWVESSTENNTLSARELRLLDLFVATLQQ